ncbi:hypothetical protein [Sphaerisporangium krabiense]|uniref:Uncharacterized protein n=1 Tax=Sphaerisporangium krabiense TaxID=763782 RepID=A0A7W9DPT4_9ACTN|nr:hypothetical protein [Sphaerisporangium krabiense]MBB5626693.1 hypothetical protein [Sphaerisporangium krabiense]
MKPPPSSPGQDGCGGERGEAGELPDGEQVAELYSNAVGFCEPWDGSYAT